MDYQRLTLFVMSGTGNTLRVAAWLGEAAAGAGLAVAWRMIERQPVAPAELGDPAAHLVGLLFPTHAFTTPWHVLRFLWRLPRGAGTHAFVLATRGGMRLWGRYVPGLEGTGVYLAALLLRLKGYAVHGGVAIDMPVSWTVVHSALAPDKVEGIRLRARPRATRFLQRLLAGRRAFGGAVGLAIGLALVPVSLAYLLVGRFYLGKLFFASRACTGCGQCAAHCPARAIRMLGGPPPRPYWTFSCESCMRCMSFCPTRAVEAGHSWAVLLAWLTHLPAGLWLLAAAQRQGLVPDTAGPVLGGLVQYAYCLGSMWLAYALFWALLRVGPVNDLFTLTTFTRCFRRYHEPETQLRDLAPRPGPAAGGEIG